MADYDCTPESPAAKATGEQQSPVPNQDSTVKIRYAMNCHMKNKIKS
jgi:hypothetical protein